jgi:hypothetical protein
MQVRYLSDAELAALSGWPEQISDEELVSFFTLSAPDLRWVRDEGRYRCAGNLLGLSVQLCALPWLGWTPTS